MNPGLRPPPTLPNNVYFPGLPQLQRHPEPVGFNPSILSQTTPGGRRPKHGNKNDRCEFCGKVRLLYKKYFLLIVRQKKDFQNKDSNTRSLDCESSIKIYLRFSKTRAI